MACIYQNELTIGIVNATHWEHNAYNAVVGASIYLDPYTDQEDERDCFWRSSAAEAQ